MMQDVDITSKQKAVSSRISRAHAVESTLHCNFDDIVIDDNKMYGALLQIKANMEDAGGNYSNTLRKYYQYVNRHCFPSLNEFEKRKLRK